MTTNKKPQTLEQKVDELQKGVALLSKAILELDKHTSDAIIKVAEISLKGAQKIAHVNVRYNAKLRRLDQKECNFHRWWSLILLCGYVLLIVLASFL